MTTTPDPNEPLAPGDPIPSPDPGGDPGPAPGDPLPSDPVPGHPHPDVVPSSDPDGGGHSADPEVRP